MSPRDALKMAQALDLDLVKVAPQAKPPVCKILDYGKYRFEMQKKEKEAKKNQKVIELKEIRLSLNIDTNDFNTKVNQAAKFLQQGHKVKVSIRFRGRQMAHTAGGLEVMKQRNEEKAKILYDFLDQSKLFKGTVRKEDRSLMNVPFVTGDADLDAKFVAEAKAAGFENLKGHRTVGGMRASIYNAMPKEGVEKLVAFMKKFEEENA